MNLTTHDTFRKILFCTFNLFLCEKLFFSDRIIGLDAFSILNVKIFSTVFHWISIVMLRFVTANSLIYQQRQQQQYGNVTRDHPRGSSPSSSRPASASSSTSQWHSTFSETFLPRSENWNSDVYAKRSATPTWTELGTQLDPRNSSWERQNSCYQKKGSPVSTWNPDHVNKRPSSATGVPSWSDVAVGYQQQRRGSLQLWQFLVALLDDPANAPCIAWTGRGMEFKLIEPEEVCRKK